MYSDKQSHATLTSGRSSNAATVTRKWSSHTGFLEFIQQVHDTGIESSTHHKAHAKDEHACPEQTQ
jgi:hypothetical protein